MRRIILAVIATALTVPGLALGAQLGAVGNGLSYCDEQYLNLYAKAEALGHPLGRNAVRAGARPDKRICKQVGKLREAVAVLTAPPPPEPVVETAAAPASGGSGGYAIPEYIVQCESGGDYNAQNPSGAYGAYQIMPGTAAAYGCDLSTPAGQDDCAGRIYAAEGSSPWVCG